VGTVARRRCSSVTVHSWCHPCARCDRGGRPGPSRAAPRINWPDPPRKGAPGWTASAGLG